MVQSKAESDCQSPDAFHAATSAIHGEVMVQRWSRTNYPGAISILVVVGVVINTQRDERH